MRHRVQLINQNKPPTSYIQQYAVYEHLGTGAFGSVYKVRPQLKIFVFAYLCFTLLYKNHIREWDLRINIEYNIEFKFQDETVLLERNQYKIHLKCFH